LKFIDKAKIFISSGSGGNGCVSFRRERSVPEGGPDGGDGGHGGNIIFVVDEEKETLIDFSHAVHFKAKTGENGGSSKCYGKSGEDLIIPIPLGTQIWNQTREIMFFDGIKPGQQFTLCKGGKGGVGNVKFTSSTNQAPKFATKGESGQEMWIWLILKLFADVGFVGFPNAGKSSLLRLITNSQTKVANYPFTTLAPELGAVQSGKFNANDKYYDKKLLIADLPGIIQGAHENKGLGLEFLGHIERCSGILHIIDVSSRNCRYLLEAMLFEIEQFSPELLQKKQLIALNKIDLVDEDELKEQIMKLHEICDFEIFPISCSNKIDVDKLIHALFDLKFSV